jgi:predicted dehydrogenase
VTNSTNGGLSRREVIKTTGAIAAASALAGVAVPFVHAAESNTIRLALVGCGGRGTGAAENALSTRLGPTKLVAMADVFPDRLNSSYSHLKSLSIAKQVDVRDDHKFIGFDAYKKAMDCLKPGDVVMLTTPPAFRWVHFTYAIEKGLNVFMEKPVAVDPGSARRMRNLDKEAKKKNLKVGVGLMCRHCVARHQLLERIRDGQIGDIVLLRAYRQAGITAKEFALPKAHAKDPFERTLSDLLYQIRWFHSFLWASGGCYSDFLIHNIDECCWMKGAWPVMAKAAGGRHYSHNAIDQNFDTYSVEYVFPDGAELRLEGRSMPDCNDEFASYAHGTKGSALISTAGHTPARCRIFKDQNVNVYRPHDPRHQLQEPVWRYPTDDEPNPYQVEWDDLMKAIREDKPYNEVERGTMASLVTAMGRMAAHTGQLITLDDMMNKYTHEFAPHVDQLTMESDAPVRLVGGKYPKPTPGKRPRRGMPWQEYYA